MFGVVLTGPRRIVLRDDLSEPEIEDGQILVRNRWLAICGSDRPFWVGAAGCDRYPYPPGFPWHETLGVVARSRSKRFKEGDRVLAVPAGQHGYLEAYVAHETSAALAPAWEERLVLAQPLGTVLNAAKRLDDIPECTAAVVGQGPIGMLWTQLLRLRGAARVIVVDRIPERLNLAAALGASDTINVTDDDAVETVRELTDGRLCDIVVEAVGAPETQSLSVKLARRNGSVLFFGVPHQREFVFPFGEFFGKFLRLTSSGGTDAWADFPIAFDLILSGRIDAQAMISHRFPHTALEAAMNLAADRRDGAVKVVLDWGECG